MYNNYIVTIYDSIYDDVVYTSNGRYIHATFENALLVPLEEAIEALRLINNFINPTRFTAYIERF